MHNTGISITQIKQNPSYPTSESQIDGELSPILSIFRQYL